MAHRVQEQGRGVVLPVVREVRQAEGTTRAAEQGVPRGAGADHDAVIWPAVDDRRVQPAAAAVVNRQAGRAAGRAVRPTVSADSGGRQVRPIRRH